jgi:hypothetical protein
LDSLYAIFVTLAIHAYEYTVLKLEFDIFFAVFGYLLEVSALR